MSDAVLKIGRKTVGGNCPAYIIAEIGINHNGSIDIAKKLIDAAVECGCDAVKFQKRTIEVVYTAEELAKPRENPFGTTNGDLKRGLEFGFEQYADIDRYCKEKGIDWLASCWDEQSVDFIGQFHPPCYKIASASLTDDNLLLYHRKFNRPIILSTGMADLSLIEHAVNILGPENLVILHCTSTYPSTPEELNLKGIKTLQQKFPNIPIGYSGHEVGLATTVAAVVLGACMIERHITLDRAMWGNDQAASVETQGFKRMVRDIRVIETAMGDGVIKIYDSEKPIIKKLRRV
ncbi:MAG: N-acetylneuraminate synthase family protein [Candidatus Schekmanbacteria bacterium]|nr:N-acetylneuraminate synthase family protein [Candidatus Schekmanbacteria bacterium]